MLKQIETEGTIGFCHIFIIVGILIGEPGPPEPPPGTPMKCGASRHILIDLLRFVNCE